MGLLGVRFWFHSHLPIILIPEYLPGFTIFLNLSFLDRLYSSDLPRDVIPYDSHRAYYTSRGALRQRRNSTSMIPSIEQEGLRSPMPLASPVPLGHTGKSASITCLPSTEGGERIPNGKLPLDENTSGSLNNLAVLSTGGFIKTSRQALRNDNYGGSGRSSRSSSIADSDRSGSMNSIPGSIASSESGRHGLYAIMNAENPMLVFISILLYSTLFYSVNTFLVSSIIE
ncbi:hypothetical protein QZH41_001478 [Actinostola sp. cb2023]|nr:hypothetical protein QZH41_001478 [Actinostola sp. cb2023]